MSTPLVPHKIKDYFSDENRSQASLSPLLTLAKQSKVEELNQLYLILSLKKSLKILDLNQDTSQLTRVDLPMGGHLTLGLPKNLSQPHIYHPMG